MEVGKVQIKKKILRVSWVDEINSEGLKPELTTNGSTGLERTGLEWESSKAAEAKENLKWCV